MDDNGLPKQLLQDELKCRKLRRFIQSTPEKGAQPRNAGESTSLTDYIGMQ